MSKFLRLRGFVAHSRKTALSDLSTVSNHSLRSILPGNPSVSLDRSSSDLNWIVVVDLFYRVLSFQLLYSGYHLLNWCTYSLAEIDVTSVWYFISEVWFGIHNQLGLCWISVVAIFFLKFAGDLVFAYPIFFCIIASRISPVSLQL